MKSLLLTLLTVTLLTGVGGYSMAWADDDDDDRKKRGLRAQVGQNTADIEANTGSIANNAAAIGSNAAKSAANMEAIQNNAAKSAANREAIQNNAANIADNFSQIQNNRMGIMDLDSRVSDLESGGPPGGGPGNARTFVNVDCNADPNALFAPPINNFFPDNTTYLIQGACNGPVYVTEDFVRFVGTGPASSSIVLPANTPSPGDGTVFGDGAQDLRIENLLIDASAWGTAAAEGSDAAGVYARNAFVRVINSDIVGGLWGINPFRGGMVRLQGTVNITEFVNAGVSVGDHSLITTRGPVNISTTRTDGSYMIGIEVYRNGVVDFRSGVTVDVPPTDFSTNFFSNSVTVTNNSHLRIRQGGIVDLRGTLSLNSGGVMTMSGGTIRGDINVSEGSGLRLFNVVQTDGLVSVRMNSNLSAFGSTLREGFIALGGVLEMNGGEFAGGNIDLNGSAELFNVFINGSLIANKPSTLTIFSSSINNILSICDEDTIRGLDTVNYIPPSGLLSDNCP